MALRKIALEGEACLSKVCRPVTDFNSRLHTLLDDLADTLADSGGVGLAEKAYRMRDILLTHARMIARDCPCEHGCPSCVGPVGEIGENGKATALALIDLLLLQKEEG